MKAIVLFDSGFGNTKQIAEAISKELGVGSKAVKVSDFNIAELSEIELFVVGSPIIGWKPSEKMGVFLSELKEYVLKGKKAASFDTRVRLFIHGDAASKISQALMNAGAEIIAPSEFFYVSGKEGPLLDGEIEKAKKWAKSIRELGMGK